MKVAITTTKSTLIYNSSLSRREVALLAGWERERRAFVTLDDIRRMVGVAVARDVASRLVAKKALERIGRGRYLVRPLRTQSRPTATSAAVQAAVLLQGDPYYLGGLWALTFHRLSEQQYVSVLDAFVDRRRTGRRLGGAQLVFHRVRSALIVCHAMSIAITVVFPAPVASFSAKRINSGLASLFAEARWSSRRFPGWIARSWSSTRREERGAALASGWGSCSSAPGWRPGVWLSSKSAWWGRGQCFRWTQGPGARGPSIDAGALSRTIVDGRSSATSGQGPPRRSVPRDGRA